MMKYEEARTRFINAWGTLGSSWGINKTMAQIHALLLISDEPLSTEQIMEELNISRGNTSMNTRALIDWGIVQKEYVAGERKEFFSADKDMWTLSRQVARERRKREIEPVLRVLEEVQGVKGGPERKVKEFKKTIGELRTFTSKMDTLLEKFIKADESWFSRTLIKLIR